MKNIPEVIDALQAAYVQALDNRDMNAWLGTFDAGEDTSYICLSAESERHGLQLALIMDDCRARLEDRVTFVTKIWAGTYQNYQTRHLTQRLSWAAAGDGTYDVLSNFSIFYTPEDTGRSEVLATGLYRDRIKLDGTQARFQSKKVITDTGVMPQYIVYPL